MGRGLERVRWHPDRCVLPLGFVRRWHDGPEGVDRPELCRNPALPRHRCRSRRLPAAACVRRRLGRYNDNRIYARRIGFNSSGGHVLQPGITVFTDSSFAMYSQPSIARSTSSGGKLMVVARRYSAIGPQRGIASTLVSARDNSVGPYRNISMNSTHDFSYPEVDGYGSRWVVAWQQNVLGSSVTGAGVRSARYDGANVVLGTQTTYGGTAQSIVDQPTSRLLPRQDVARILARSRSARARCGRSASTAERVSTAPIRSSSRSAGPTIASWSPRRCPATICRSTTA